MKVNETQKCIELCKKLMNGRYSNFVKWVIWQYWTFFDNHQALIDGMALNRLWEVGGKVIQDFLERERWMKEDVGHEPVPILIENEIPPEIKKALHILNDGMQKALRNSKLIYYNLSLKIPSEALQRWLNPIEFYIVESREEATRLSMTSRIRLEIIEKMESEKRAKKTEKDSEVKGINEQGSGAKQGNPYASDGFGDLIGERPDGIRPVGNRGKW